MSGKKLIITIAVVAVVILLVVVIGIAALWSGGWLLAGAWLPIAAVALVRVWAAYHYGVLHHYCPWCLFLPEHHMIGFPVWIAWLVVAYEAPAALVLSLPFIRKLPGVSLPADVGARQAARNMLMAVVFFVLLAVGPAIWWRLHFGMWLNG